MNSQLSDLLEVKAILVLLVVKVNLDLLEAEDLPVLKVIQDLSEV